MMNTVRLELTKSIRPDFNWKVSKGCRSQTRRLRKPVDRCQKLVEEIAGISAKSPLETTVSESEKLGVAVLGRRFGDKIEQVPIKKRRLMVRSPSPPPCPQLEHKQQVLGAQHASGQKSFSKSVARRHPSRSETSKLARSTHTFTACGVNKHLKEVRNKKPGDAEDFSGIEILAAAACNNSMNDDISHVQKNPVGEDASTSARPLEQSIRSTTCTAIRSRRKLSEAREASTSAILEESLASFETNGRKENPSEENNEAVARSISSKDVKFHWDLNVSMDAWEEPCDMSIDGSQTVPVDNRSMDNKQGEKVLKAHQKLEDADAKKCIVSTVQALADNEEQGLKAYPEIGMSYGNCVPTDDGKSAKASSGVDACLDHSPRPGLVNNRVPLSEETSVKGMTDNIASGVQLGETVCLESVDHPVIACAPEGASCEVESTVLDGYDKGSGATSSIHDDPKSPEETMVVESCHSHAAVLLEAKSVGKTETVAVDHYCDGKSASGASETPTVGSLQNAASEEVMHKSSGNSIVDPVSAAGSSSHEQCQYGGSIACSLGRVTTEDPMGGNYGMNVYQNDKNRKGGNQNTKELEAGYDSQYEDGELRESDAPRWEGNEFDEEEAECVDYGSDTCDSDVADDSRSEKVNRNGKVMGGLSPGSDNMCEKNEHCTAGHALRQSSVGSKTKTSGSDQFPGDSEASSNRTKEATEGCTIRRHTSDYFDGIDGKHSPAKVVGSVSSDSLNRMSALSARRRRLNNYDMSIRSEEAGSDQSTGKEKSDSRMYGKASGGSLVNPSVGYWDSKRRESPSYRGSFGSGRFRPRSFVDNQGYEIDPDETFSEASGVQNRVRRPSITFNSNRMHQPPFRRRSPSERNDTPNMHRGMMPLRDTSPDRRRFRRYPQGVNRGFREEYPRPMPDDPNECSYNVPRRMARRELSTSPPGRGPIYYSRPYNKFQPRCRSRSPPGWGFSRERNDVSRHRGSRSPDYRFNPKTEKQRVPFQKQNFGAKYEVGFLSPPKRRFSPHQNSRCFDDSNSGADHSFKGRRLAERRFQPRQRFDSVRPTRRLNSDDYFEPMVRPARFSELPSGGRECRYDGSDDDRRKPDGRFEIIRRVRRFDTDGVVRQFRYDGEDRFASRNTRNFDGCDTRQSSRNLQNFDECGNRTSSRNQQNFDECDTSQPSHNTQNFDGCDNRAAERRANFDECDNRAAERQVNFDESDNRVAERRPNFDECDNRVAERRPGDALVGGEVVKRRVN